jgi:hypothetical protein
MGTFAEQQTSITVYRLPTKENKLLFSVSVCSKQTEVCHFRFPFSANKRKLPLSVNMIIRLRNPGNLEAWRHEDADMETWRHRHETWKHREMET